MKNKKSLRILSFLVIGYMLMALLWWAILLHRKNTEVFVLKSDLLKETFKNKAGVTNVDVTTMPEFQELKSYYERQMYMIFGEAVVSGVVNLNRLKGRLGNEWNKVTYLNR